MLTEKETFGIKELWASSRGNGHDFGITDEMPSIPKKSRGGIVGSLVKKGLLDIYPVPELGLVQFVFTEAGKALFSDFDNADSLVLENP